jgi:hypothetical protein
MHLKEIAFELALGQTVYEAKFDQSENLQNGGTVQ